MNKQEVIRHIESTVLDREHQRNPLFNLSHRLAVQRLMKMFGDVAREMDREVHTYSGWVSSLNHCLRWAHALCPAESVTREPPWRQQDQHALDLLLWGTQYARLFRDHVAWSRGLLHADADQGSRTITFGDQNTRYGFVIKQQDIDQRETMILSDKVADAVDVIYRHWHRKMRWNTIEGLVYPAGLLKSMKELEPIREWCNNLIFPELPSNEPLGEYSIGELREFYACTYSLCACVSRLEEQTDQIYGDENLMGSWVHMAQRENMLEWFRASTGLRREAIEAIVRDSTLDPTRTHGSLFSTPFIVTKCDFLLFSPRLYSNAHPQRTLLSALTIGSGRRAYEKVSEKIERWWIAHIVQTLRTRGLRVQPGLRLKFPSGPKSPDLVFLDPSTSTLFIMEFKNYIPPLDVGAVFNRIVEFKKGIKQIQEYIHLTQGNIKVVERALQCDLSGVSMRGVLLMRHPMPLPVDPPPDVSIVDWPSISDILTTNHGISVTDAVHRTSAIDNRPLSFGEDLIYVQRWKYRRILPLKPESESGGASE